MKPRRDRLAAIAQRKEQMAERALLERRRNLAAAEEEVRAAVTRTTKKATDHPASVGEFLNRQQIDALRARAVTLSEADRAEAEFEVLTAREAWLEAARHRKTVDRLTERDRAARAVVAARASQRVLDDVALRIRRVRQAEEARDG